MSDSEWHTLATVAIAVCWGLWAVAWLGGAAYNARRAPAVAQRRATPSFALALAVGAAWLVLRAVPGRDWHPLDVDSPTLRVLGVGLLAASTAFTLWARAALGTMWSASTVAKDEHVLRTDGPYSITRHPIYTGMLGMLIGSGLAAGLGRWVGLFLVGVLVVEVKIRAEERLLTEVFPREYERYRRRVPQLVPGLKRLSRG